jgi:RimJ/RimL family protein N-acetyltransferase
MGFDSKLLRSKMTFNKKITLVDDYNQEIGIAALEHEYANTFSLKIKKIEPLLTMSKWRDAFSILVQEAHAQQASQVKFRLVKNIGLDNLIGILNELNFNKKRERIEYKQSVEALPIQKVETQLKWKTAEELNWTIKQISNALLLVAEDDPAYDPSEKPEDFIQDFLQHDELTHGLSCIHFGFIGDALAAMTVVQCNFNAGVWYGWSRVSYIGVSKEYRGQGYGAEAHLYSFQIMKNLGGLLYHGGTSSLNTPMIRLFEKHNCTPFKKMEEWAYSMKEVTNETN